MTEVYKQILTVTLFIQYSGIYL